MVSLVNFKSFSEDISQHQRAGRPVEGDEQQRTRDLSQNVEDAPENNRTTRHPNPVTSRTKQQQQRQDKSTTKTTTTSQLNQKLKLPQRVSTDYDCYDYKPTTKRTNTSSSAGGGSDSMSTSILMLGQPEATDLSSTASSQFNQFGSSNTKPTRNAALNGLSSSNNNNNDDDDDPHENAINKHQSGAKQVTNFTITWRNLKFSIEPKWHEKLTANSSSLGRLVGRLAGRPGPLHSAAAPSSSSSTGSACLAINSTPAQQQQQQQEQHQQANQITSNNLQLNQTQSSANTNSSQAVTRVVLDRLDGSFKSGELTAILGPSGAGKTTLLDCLTGHRKHGLSGTIRISSSSVGTTTPNGETNCCSHQLDSRCCCCYVNGDNGAQRQPMKMKNLTVIQSPVDQRQHSDVLLATSTISSTCSCGCTCSSWKQQAQQEHFVGQSLTNGDNLKVSIIPQNDHLMGHLTVYETLNYASKMKNCFDKHFNHKLNIRRVAQQLGLMSCLGTRINKLSGGQYKRVSIAQELLSSPDILILDEPTSGLDAMTCYQTVQVLKKLTDEMKTDNDGVQKQIAVILTIHQPNSDVFQQFNNVYVVAQGGKCIYEGPPSGIESVINRIGIHLPNSYYNPATMIVEIAAGKFGSEAIQKLNSIQRKQYEFIYLNDEQNSTGDSAVDCPSSSSSPSSDNDEDDEGPTKRHQGEETINNNNYPGTICCDNIKLNRKQGDKFVEINNNGDDNAASRAKPLDGGLINKGFITDEQSDSLNTSEIKVNNNIEIFVVPQKTIVDYDQQLLAGRRAAEEPPVGYKSNTTGVHETSSATNESNNNNNSSSNNNNKRKKRRRRRLHQKSETQIATNDNFDLPLKSSAFNVDQNNKQVSVCNGAGGSDGGGGGGGGGREKRLKLNSLKADQRFPFWRHTYLHFHRSWLSIVRDPMLCSMQLALHIIVPVMVSLVYGTTVGKPNACPRAGPVDIMAYALEPTDTALQLQEDLRTTLENIGYIFFKLYGIIFAAMTVTVLTFPLDMHVLVKEFRNGWYGLSSYFLGRTLADIPFQLTLPLLAMSLSYYATGQPYSYMQWRFLSITAILILSSLIAQSQGLLFGAILMDKMKAAVFVAPAATTPIILFAGFLVRTQSIPRYLRPLSNLSYLRYAIEACLISRYGFNQCECDPAIFNQTVPELPPIARSMLDYWLGSFKASATSEPTSTTGESSLVAALNETSLGSGNQSLLLETTTLASETERPDLFTKLIDSLAKANSFGRNITSCEQVVPYPMIDYDLKDSQLVTCFAILLLMLVFTRFLTFFIVCFKVKRKV